MAESLYFKRFSLTSKQMMLQIREPIAMLSLAYTYFVLLYKQLRFFEQLKLQPPVYAPAMYCYSIQQSWCFRKWNTAEAKRSIKYQSNIIFRGLGQTHQKKKSEKRGARSCDDGMEVQEAALAIEAARSKAKKKGKHSKYLPTLPFS